ncbi:hypothetical protein MAHJHV58_36840 [Mycobacterium avium subsp. hominissuis]
MCIVSITRPEPRVYQPDPPGLMHDDPRLLPPLAGVVPFLGSFRAVSPGFRALRPVLGGLRRIGPPSLAVRARAGFVHSGVSIPKSASGTGVPTSRPRTVNG